MSKLIKIFSALLMLLFVSCKKDYNFGEVTEKEPLTLFQNEGVWVVNEGIFGQGNGELSFIDWKTKKIYNSQFFAANKIPAGDIPTSLLVDSNVLLFAINNSSKIYVLNRKNLKIQQTINNIPSPRQIIKYAESKYVVSSFNTDSLFFINLGLNNYTVNSMFLGKSSENLLFHNNRIYLTNWSSFGGNWQNSSIMKINPFEKKIDSILIVGKEPNSMVLDKNLDLWVLCSGGFLNEEFPSLHKIDLNDFEIQQTYFFNSKTESPISLSSNKNRDTIYFINEDIYAMSINSSTLPTVSYINSSLENFYYINASIFQDYILVTNARNFQTSGEVLIFNKNPIIIKRLETNINPSFLSFNSKF